MGHRLLVVDSDRRFLQDHKASLEAAFDVDFREGTEGSLAHLEGGEYAAVLLCVEASENKGYSLCSAVRRSPLLADLKVALISARATDEEYARHQSLKGKADLYLHKPIRPNALVSALTPLMPMKLADLDNPLGDLGGADLGDEWLESLKNELEVESAPQEPPPLPLPVPISTVLGYGKPILPQVAQAVSRIPTIPKDAGRVELLEARVKDLETKLVTSFEDMERKQRELDDLVHNGEAAQSLFEEKTLLSMDLENRLGTTERALEELRGQEQEARERLQEKTRLTLDLMESNQLLQAQLAEAKEEADRSAQALQARAEALESERGEALGAREQLELELAELRSRVAEQQANHHRQQMELLAAIDDREGRLGRMQETLNGLQEQIQSLEQEMEAGVAQFQTRTSRLQAVIERLSDLEAQTRQALEFAKTEME